MSYRTILAAAAGLAALSLVGCGNAAGPGGPAVLTKLVPVFSFAGSGARVLASDSLGQIGNNVAMGCPALRGFSESASGVSEGGSFQVSFLGTGVDFSVASFSGGPAGRIASGVRYSGASADDSVLLTVELDPATKDFYFEERLYFDDPSGVTNQPMTAYDFYKMKGVVAADGSILCAPVGITFITWASSGTNPPTIIAYKDMEYYSGPWTIGQAAQGVGLVIEMESGNGIKSYASLPATLGSFAKPGTAPELSAMANDLGYLDAYLDTCQAGTYTQSLLMTSVDGASPFFSVYNSPAYCWPDGAAAPVTKADAKSRLPSDAWKAKSALAP
jgi:hypothetical protein